MISITEAISDLLFVRDTVVVPGLGAFVKKTTSAKVNPVANFFTMPNCDIVFDANLREDNDLIVNYLIEENNVSIEETKKQLVMFVSDCFNKLKNREKVVLDRIGTLSYDWDNNLVFVQDKSVNYNADAFGLCDFTPKPVLRSKTKDEIKAEIAQQQKDKNTPVTVDEKAVHEHDREDDDNDKPRGRGWLWVLFGLLLAVGVLFGLQYFKVVEVKQWFGQTEQSKEVEPWKVILPTEVKPWPTQQTVSEEDDIYAENLEVNIQIIGGCYDREESAACFAKVLKDKGYTGAFYELRNDKWYVSFGRYATMEEATAALREIRANTDYKAWIWK